MLNIKEIAELVSKKIYVEDGLLLSKFISEKFAEALIESYKAELLKEVGEPVSVNCWWEDSEYQIDDPETHAYECGMEVGAEFELVAAYYITQEFMVIAIDDDGDAELEYKNPVRLFTSDQAAVAILKATKPLDDQLAKAEQRVAEWQPISTAPKDGVVVFVSLHDSNIPQPARFAERTNIY